MPGPRYTHLVAQLPSTVPFVGPETLERRRGSAFRARIGANESVFGPSPKAVAAMAEAARDCWMYCDPENHELKAALASFHGLSSENVCVGEGIDALLGYTVRLVTEPGDTIVTSQGAYPTFNFHVAGFGGRLVTVPYTDDREDPAALIEAAKAHKAKLIYLTNPDNPMGTWWPASVIDRMSRALPEGTVLCLDEAYVEFAPADASPAFDVTNPNVLRFRTFSKAYGMAGARVGYVIGEASVIQSFDKIRNHFGVNRIAQAGAIAALADQQHLQSVVEQTASARKRITAIAKANGLSALASATNFVAVDLGRDGDFARKVLARLNERGVFVRMPGVAPLDRCIRIGCGKPQDLELVADELAAALRASA